VRGRAVPDSGLTYPGEEEITEVAEIAGGGYIHKSVERTMDMTETVPASEFTKNFGRYKMLAQRQAVAVSSHGQIAGYFVGAHEYEELLKLKGKRRSFATADLPDEKVRAITSSRMAKRHDHLNKVLDRK